jgi:uncharacterized membrane protein YidH (DUF202 family)
VPDAGGAAGRGRGGGEGVRIRDHLANVRTLLAWTRLAAAILAVAYVIAKLELLSLPRGSNAIGSDLIGPAAGVAGAIVAAGALRSFLSQRSAIEGSMFRPNPTRDLILIGLAAAGGLAVMAYLFSIR